MTAAQHPLDPGLFHPSTSLSSLVLGQLLPHGRHRIAIRDELWREEGGRLDDGMMRSLRRRAGRARQPR